MFVASEGLPPAAFVLQERMCRAARLLTSHSLLPVKEIAKRDHVLRWIVDSASAGARLDEPYQSRADRFFEFRDADNCRRVWTAISSAFPPTE